MSFIINPAESGDGKAVPNTGLNQAVLVSIVDFGTQESKDYGEKRQVYLNFALTSQSHVFDEEKGAEPFHCGKVFTMSLHEKSSLTAALTGMLRGNIPKGPFDMGSLLGKNFTLNLVEVTKDDKKYINIGSFSPLMPQAEPVEMETNSFSFNDYKQEDFDKLHDWQKEKISKGPEYKKATETPF